MTAGDRSSSVRRRALEVLAGGVSSPVRAFRAVGGEPVIGSRGAGARLVDADGREYVDYVGSWGAMILGHGHPAVTRAVAEQAARGASYGFTTELEVQLAEEIRAALPSMERIRLVSSGTEAAMSAIRLARAFTGRDHILKFEGGYHGHADSFLSQAGSGLATLGIASSAGVPEAFAALTWNVAYNDVIAVEREFSARGSAIAAVIVEPVAANMGVVPPAPGFLEALRGLTERNGALLIFDEVITGFRAGWAGAQGLFGIRPDLTLLGKIIGGGLPVAAYGGRAEIMRMVAPEGPVYQAGTLSGNPVAMAAGLATLKQLESPEFYAKLEARGRRLAEGLRAAVQESGIAASVNAIGSLATLFFAVGPVRDYAGAKRSDTARFARFFHEMLGRGILLPPSQFEALFISAAHTDADIDRTIAACRESLASVQRDGESRGAGLKPGATFNP
ncbi:MAG TPA: glutamate-1-semialdehyde 2,1-aminomutase [Candidatus Acidoferrales bacterium]|nr:glutamate-1-semialdehyde 2,1-aminomutase [Candidatus Acidoferrales bacterium]